MIDVSMRWCQVAWKDLMLLYLHMDRRYVVTTCCPVSCYCLQLFYCTTHLYLFSLKVLCSFHNFEEALKAVKK